MTKKRLDFKRILFLSATLLFSISAMSQQDRTIVLKNVVVLGTQNTTSIAGQRELIRQIPQSISLIQSRQIREFNLNTLDEALQQVTGVTTIVNDNMRSHYKARGYHMSVMYDGLPSYNSLSISQQLNLAFYEQIEVLRGPAGLLQGVPDAQSIGGVINLVSKTPYKTLDINTLVSVGSWNNYRSEIDVNIPLNKSKTLRSRWIFFGNDRNFFYERSHQTQLGGYGTIEWDVTPTTLISASYSFQDTKSDVVFNGIPAVRKTSDDPSRNILQTSRSTNPTPDWDWTKWQTQNVFLSIKQKINDDWSATLKANYRMQTQENKFAWAGTITLADTTSNFQRGYNHDDIPRLTSALDVTGKFKLFNQEHSVFAGFNMEHFENDKHQLSGYYMAKWGHPELIPDFTVPPRDQLPQSKTRITQGGLYGKLHLSVLKPLKIILGGRLNSVYANMYDFTNLKWIDILKDKYRFSPYGGIIYNPLKQLTFYASYSDLFVPQTEKKEDGSLLDPRVGSQFEIGTKNAFFNNRLNFNLAFFYVKDNKRAYRISPTAFINGGKVENKGIDLEANATPLKGVELIAGYTYLKTKIVKSASGDEGLAFSPVEPEHSFKFWGIYRFEQGVLQNLSAGIGVMAYSPKWASILTPERRQDGYAIMNTFVSYTVKPHLSFNLNLNNIFDTIYYARVGGNGDYFGEPRNFSLSMRCDF